MQFITRAYNSIKLNKHAGTITKRSKDSRLKDEKTFYANLPKELNHFYPKLVSFQEINQIIELELEYLPFQNLGEILHANTNLDVWLNICLSLKHVLDKFLTVEYSYYSKDQVEQFRHEMFIEKTQHEFEVLKTGFDWFKEFTTHEQVSINGKSYRNFEVIWPEIKKYIIDEIITDKPMTFMHGDMCFSNILCGIDKENNCVIKLIDPRGGFGTRGNHGDQYYDLAKLLHSIDGKYENIIYDRFTIDQPSLNELNFLFHKDNTDEVHNLMKTHLFDKFKYLHIKLLEGLIFIGMCARHYDSVDRQKIMYCTGVRILNECLEEIKQ